VRQVGYLQGSYRDAGQQNIIIVRQVFIYKNPTKLQGQQNIKNIKNIAIPPWPEEEID